MTTNESDANAKILGRLKEAHAFIADQKGEMILCNTKQELLFRH
jgi:hypothetical protein